MMFEKRMLKRTFGTKRSDRNIEQINIWKSDIIYTLLQICIRMMKWMLR